MFVIPMCGVPQVPLNKSDVLTKSLFGNADLTDQSNFYCLNQN